MKFNMKDCYVFHQINYQANQRLYFFSDILTLFQLWKENERNFANGKQDENTIPVKHNKSAPSLNAMSDIKVDNRNFDNSTPEGNAMPMPEQFDLSTFQTFPNGLLPNNFMFNNNQFIMPTTNAMNIPFYSNMKIDNITSSQSDWDIVKAALSLNVTTPDFSSHSQNIEGNPMIPSQTKSDSDKSQYLENNGEIPNIGIKNHPTANNGNANFINSKLTEENNKLHYDLKENGDNKKKEIREKIQINQVETNYNYSGDQAIKHTHKSLAQFSNSSTSIKNHKDVTSKNDKMSKDDNYNPLMRDLGNESSQTDGCPIQSVSTQLGNEAFPWERKNNTRKIAGEATIPWQSTERNRFSRVQDVIDTDNYGNKRSENRFSNANDKDVGIPSENMINKPLHNESNNLTQRSLDSIHSNQKSVSMIHSDANEMDQITNNAIIDNIEEDSVANRVDIIQNSKNEDYYDVGLIDDLDTLSIGSDDPLSKSSQRNRYGNYNITDCDSHQGKKYHEGNKIRNYNYKKSAANDINTDNSAEVGNNDSSKKGKVYKVPTSGMGQSRQTSNYNPSWVDLNNYQGARFFVIKSYYEDDIYYSIKTSSWSSTDYGNKKLNRAYCDCQGTRFIYLFFSVNGSGHFCGVARMTSEVFYKKSVTLWQQNKWEGKFTVEWIYVKDVPNFALKHIRLENNNYKAITNSRDCQEVPGDSARTAMKIIHHYQHETSIFDDSEYYEKKLKQKIQTVSTFSFNDYANNLLAIPIVIFKF